MNDYKDFKKINIEEISNLEKITLVKISDFGYPIVLNLKLQEIKLKDYAQYKNCLYVIGKLPRKQKARGYLIKPNDEFVIYKGTISEAEFNDFRVKSNYEGSSVTDYGECFSSGAIIKYNINNVESLVSSLNL